MEHSELKKGGKYTEVGLKHSYLICVEISQAIVNTGWNTYAKTAKFKRINYSVNLRDFDSVVIKNFHEINGEYISNTIENT